MYICAMNVWMRLHFGFQKMNLDQVHTQIPHSTLHCDKISTLGPAKFLTVRW